MKIGPHQALFTSFRVHKHLCSYSEHIQDQSWLGCVCVVCVVWHAENLRVWIQNVSVCASKTPVSHVPMSSPQAHACHALNTYTTHAQHTHPQHTTHTVRRTDRERHGHRQTLTRIDRQTTGLVGWCVCDCS